jgi:hypothetical protein
MKLTPIDALLDKKPARKHHGLNEEKLNRLERLG